MYSYVYVFPGVSFFIVYNLKVSLLFAHVADLYPCHILPSLFIFLCVLCYLLPAVFWPKKTNGDVPKPPLSSPKHAAQWDFQFLVHQQHSEISESAHSFRRPGYLSAEHLSDPSQDPGTPVPETGRGASCCDVHTGRRWWSRSCRPRQIWDAHTSTTIEAVAKWWKELGSEESPK